jgi:hypothetical protein
VTAICPTNGRSCAAISNTESDTPVANSPIASNDASRSSQCTNAIASEAHRSRHREHLHRMIDSQREFLPPGQ